MNEEEPFKPPEITNEDICWAAQLLGLPDKAFHGADNKDPRLEVFKCLKSIDVTACPGSGKTTLLVAKLAVLANKWEHRTRGICVLSHTNAARDEIEGCLGCSSVGRQLLAYPHFIGTIHGFVSNFLALPLLRSRGYPITMIDTEKCLEKRWKALPVRTRKGLERNHLSRSVLTIKSPDCDVGTIKWGRGQLGVETPTYKQIHDVCKKSVNLGFFCYEELFIWASLLIDESPDFVNVIRDRFPLLFIDEAQDNSEEQSEILHRIFMKSGDEVIRQRFGDLNQAIYGFFGAKGANTDTFPSDGIKKSIPNSYRFGVNIAKLAEPLGCVPHDGGLVGNGPKQICSRSNTTEGSHTIFLLQEDTIDQIIPAYANLLINTFTEEEREQGIFTAMGQVHKSIVDDDKPRHVGHYWLDYDAELSKADPQPRSFVQYVRAGQFQAELLGEVAPAVEKIAQGLLRFASTAENGRSFHRRQRSHRYVQELISSDADTRGLYTLLVSRFGIKKRTLQKFTWEKRWVNIIQKIGEQLAGCSLSNNEANEFLVWDDHAERLGMDGDKKLQRDNIYRYPTESPRINIRVGSVHSMKGQTHTATLVLETFWHKHNLQSILEWISGTNRGCNGVKGRQLSRLKLHYVAMTRPTHLLCLAMKRKTFEDESGELDSKLVTTLEEHGWNLKSV